MNSEKQKELKINELMIYKSNYDSWPEDQKFSLFFDDQF